MTLPAQVAVAVSDAVGARIVREQPIGGGCIHHGARIDTDAGTTYFLKWNASAAQGMFEAEADGLQAIRASGSLRAPSVVAWGEDWLLLEYVATARPAADTHERLGRGLAAMHTSASERTFGWRRDNWIGSLPQANRPAASWADFWRDRRLAPQLERARLGGYLQDATATRALDAVLEVIPTALADVTRPELVHGDLWGGNWLVAEVMEPSPGTVAQRGGHDGRRDPLRRGEPVLIDPAVYLGHGEVDLTMSELFGGFERAFYDAYHEVRGISAEYRAYRRDLYQLYYLLVHVNLFGASYEASALRAAQRVAAALT